MACKDSCHALNMPALSRRHLAGPGHYSPKSSTPRLTKLNLYGISCTIFIAGTLLLTGSTLLGWQRRPSVVGALGPGRSTRGPHTPYTPSQQLSGPALYAAVRTHHPINRLQCGAWVQQYAQLHRDILSGKAPQRYAVMRSKQEFGNGLADRLASSVTILLYAILTDRAFQYDWDPPPPSNISMEALQKEEYGRLMFFEPSTHLWEGLRSDHIDWRYTGIEVGNSSTTMDYNCDKGTEEYKAFFRHQDVTEIGKGFHTVVWHADHAQVWSSFGNPHLKARLAQLGLQQETAFACLFDFLYRPTQEVMDMFKSELSVLLDPKPLKVGVQIRVGDWQLVDSYAFKPQNLPWLFDHYFECAQDIGEELAQPGQPVVWYTLTDIPELRPLLAERWGGRLLINTDVAVEHTVKSKTRSDLGFKQAAGELWVFSLTSAHIITKKSGFGKVPAMVNANGTQHIFVKHYPMDFFGMVGLDNRKNVGWQRHRKCTTQFADSLDFVCNDFTGI